jgi:hypothetical protein
MVNGHPNTNPVSIACDGRLSTDLHVIVVLQA